MTRDYPEAPVPAGHSEPAPRRVRGVLGGRTVFDTTNARYVWRGERNYVSLDPHVCPAHVFRIRRPLAGTDRFA